MRTVAFVLLGAFAAAAAPAAPLIFSGTVRAELGYGSNPFLVTDNSTGAGYAGLAINPTLTRTTARSTTTLGGTYYRQQYFGDFGHSETIGATLAHTQQLTERLTLNVAGSYVDSDNALLSPGFDPAVVDVLTAGQHARTFTFSGGLAWQATSRDSFTASGNYARSSYGQGGLLIASDYTSYGGTVGYQRAVSARTKLGVLVSASDVRSQFYPDSSSISPAISLQQVLSPTLTFNGNIGLIRQHVSGPYGRSSSSVGFQAQLCRTYAKRQICASAGRQSAPSGFGGLRTAFDATVTGSQQLTERSSISFTGTYEDSRSKDVANGLPFGVQNLPDERVFQARVDYNRTLTRRLSAGASAYAQWRDFGGFGTAHGYGGSLNLIYRVGRI